MKIAVVGTCQAPGVAACLSRRLVDACYVQAYHLPVTLREIGAAKAAEELSKFDIVFTHEVSRLELGELSIDKLRHSVKRLIVFPSLVYVGFHPDICYIHRNGSNIIGPLGPLHSALAAGAFLNDLPTQQAANLFNKFVYSRLRYLDYSNAFEKFDASFERYPLMGAKLLESGVFMHTSNHPHIRTLDALASTLTSHFPSELLRLSPRDMPPDDLASSVVWPVYPEIAEEMGLMPTEMTFRTHGGEKLDLLEFLGASYECFRANADAVADSPIAMSTAKVLRRELRREELQADHAPEFIDALYEVVLGRVPDDTGRAAFVRRFRELPVDNRYGPLIAAFIKSQEGSNRTLLSLSRDKGTNPDAVAAWLRDRW